MADDAGDWLSEAIEETKAAEPAEAPAPGKEKKGKEKGKDKDKEKKPKKKKEKAAAQDAAAAAAAAAAQPPEADLEYLDPDKLILFKHWIRPKFLQYGYIYDYRHNYYDDVIDYLNKRQCGVYRDIPIPQTWAERALRTYNSKINKLRLRKDADEDMKLCTKIRLGCCFHLYHSKEYFNRRYASIM